MRALVIAFCVAQLVGCSSLPALLDDSSEDDERKALGTLVVPTGDADCQYRKGVVSGGGGAGAAVSGGFEVVTVTNAELCTEPKTIQAIKDLF